MSYAYNGDGRRVSQTPSGGATVSYVDDIVGGLSRLLSDGTRKYVWGLGLAYAVDSQNHLQVYYTDGQGSVRAITDGTGSITTTYQTDAFGNPTATVGALGQPFAFTGQEQDLNNLVYLHTRYDDPMTGRFLSRDPFFGFLGDPLSLNRYTYTENNPVSAVDPGGMALSRVLKAAAKGFKCWANPNQPMCRGSILQTIWGIGVYFPGQGDLATESAAKAEMASSGAGGGGGGTLPPGYAAVVARTASTDARAALGARRVLRAVAYFGIENVADLSQPELTTPGVKSYMPDIILKNGALVEVGGHAKGFNLSRFGEQMTAMAGNSGPTGAYFMYEPGTSESVLRIARRHVGAANVIPLP